MGIASAMNNPFINRLMEAGIIPKNCRSFTLKAKAGDMIRIEYEVFVTDEQMRIICESMEAESAVVLAGGRTFSFQSPNGDKFVVDL